MKNGTVKFFDRRKGWGFIAGEDGEEIYVHFSALVMDGYKSLRQNDQVTYDVGEHDGRVCAVNVKKI